MVGHRWVRTLATRRSSRSARRPRSWPRRSQRGTVRGRRPACTGEGAGPGEPAPDRGAARPGGDRRRAVVPRGPATRRSGALAGQRLVVGPARSRRAGDARPADRKRSRPVRSATWSSSATTTGPSSRLSALDVGRRLRAAPLDTTADVIRRATVSPDGSTVYEARVARRDRADLGIWSRPLDGRGAGAARPAATGARRALRAHLVDRARLVGRGRPARGPVVRRGRPAGRGCSTRPTAPSSLVDDPALGIDGRRRRWPRDRLRRVPRVPVPARRDRCRDRRASSSWPRRPARPSWCRTGATRGSSTRRRRPTVAACAPSARTARAAPTSASSPIGLGAGTARHRVGQRPPVAARLGRSWPRTVAFPSPPPIRSDPPPRPGRASVQLDEVPR